MNKKILILLIGLFVILLFLFGYAQYTKEDSYTVTVRSITVQQNVSGSKESVTTTYHYIVSTDKGLFEIEPAGIMASPHFGTLKEGKTYNINTRGYTVPIIGLYPYIIEAEIVNDPNTTK